MSEDTKVRVRSDVEDMYLKSLDRHLGNIVQQLHELADDVARHRTDLGRVPAPGLPMYAGVVGRVQHQVLWGLANLSLDGLAEIAANADVARLTEGKE